MQDGSFKIIPDTVEILEVKNHKEFSLKSIMYTHNPQRWCLYVCKKGIYIEHE